MGGERKRERERDATLAIEQTKYARDCDNLVLSTYILHTHTHTHTQKIRHQNPDKFKFKFPASFDFGDRSLLTFGQITCL